MSRARALTVALAAVIVAVAALFALPPVLDRALNRVVHGESRVPSRAARKLFDRLFIADLHADSLLWGRDLSVRNRHGHVDLPRLLEGRVALQVFGIVTRVPLGINIERNSDRFDVITLLMLARRAPRPTWTSLTARALEQSHRLEELAARSGGRLTMIRTRADLDAFIGSRRDRRGSSAAMLAVEGAHALDGSLDNIETLFGAGVRMMAPTHFFDTRLGGSAHGTEKGGLTEMGAAMIARMEELGMTLDLAHASSALIDDALAVAKRPVVVSHTGVKATCDNTRNLSDDHVRAIAATGGVIGIGYWETAVCGDTPGDIARAIRAAVDLVGAGHVALGSDFDGAVATPFDTTGLVALVDALLAMDLRKDEITRIMGANVVRVLRANLPDQSVTAPREALETSLAYLARTPVR